MQLPYPKYSLYPGDIILSKTALVPAHTGFITYRQRAGLVETMGQLQILGRSSAREEQGAGRGMWDWLGFRSGPTALHGAQGADSGAVRRIMVTPQVGHLAQP